MDSGFRVLQISLLTHVGDMSKKNTEKQLLISQIQNHSDWEGVEKSRNSVVVETEGWWFGDRIHRNPTTD